MSKGRISGILMTFLTVLGGALVIPSALAGTDPSNTLRLGDGAASNKRIIMNRGGSNAQIRWNESSSKLQFSNDGTSFSDFGSGSGSGGGGFNVLTNPGFESGIVDGWTNTGGTFAAVSAGSNLLIGIGSATFTASAGSQFVASSLYDVPEGLKGRACVVSVLYKGGSSNLTLQAYDGTNVLASTAFVASTTATPLSAPFICPSSGQFQLRVLSSASSAIVALDQMFLGENQVLNISQATKVGYAKWPATASCSWSTTSSSFANYATDADCTFPAGSNLSGSLTAPATKVPGFTIANLAPGKYQIAMSGSMFKDNATNTVCDYRMSDGTNTSLVNLSRIYNSTGTLIVPYVVFEFEYTSAQSNITFQVQGKNADGASLCQLQAVESDLLFSVYRYPTETETAFRAETINWRVDANISGANPDLGSSVITSYTEITNSGLTLTNNTGNSVIGAQIPCSTTNPPTGTTCSAGNESLGVSFVLPRTGDVLACASFSHHIRTGLNTADQVSSTFQIVETPTNAQTILQEGKSRIEDRVFTNNGAQQEGTVPHRICGTFTFSSVGQKVLRLMYEQFVVGTPDSNIIYADADSSNGQRDIHWEVYPINQGYVPPVLSGNVSSNSAGSEKIERATLLNNGASTCSVTSSSGSWIGSPVANGTGDCSYTITGFPSAPSCTCTVNSGGPDLCTAIGPTSSTARFFITRTSTSSAIDGTIHIMCMGAR